MILAESFCWRIVKWHLDLFRKLFYVNWGSCWPRSTQEQGFLGKSFWAERSAAERSQRISLYFWKCVLWNSERFLDSAVLRLGMTCCFVLFRFQSVGPCQRFMTCSRIRECQVAQGASHCLCGCSWHSRWTIPSQSTQEANTAISELPIKTACPPKTQNNAKVFY